MKGTNYSNINKILKFMISSLYEQLYKSLLEFNMRKATFLFKRALIVLVLHFAYLFFPPTITFLCALSKSNFLSGQIYVIQCNLQGLF